jgi:hypothetical protein
MGVRASLDMNAGKGTIPANMYISQVGESGLGLITTKQVL